MILRVLGCLGASLAVVSGALAQGAPPPVAGASQACIRLESQLAAIDRGAADQVRADQTRRFEEAQTKQQYDLDRVQGQARKLGCESTGFFLFRGPQSPQCDALNNQIQQMRNNLERISADLRRLQASVPDRSEQRRGVLVALAENNCGPQYRQAAAAAQPRGFFDQLFGGNNASASTNPADVPQSSTFRTVCVRTCDGFYFPISYSTVPAKFGDDERTCQRLCPASEVVLYSHRNPGEDMSQSVSVSGRPYKDLPNAFKYRTEFNPSCSCKRAGESWADALKDLDDRTVERGDIVVTEEQAKAMAQPKAAQPAKPAAGKGRNDPKAVAAPAAPAEAEKPAEAPATTASTPAGGKPAIRTVGPQFYPVR